MHSLVFKRFFYIYIYYLNFFIYLRSKLCLLFISKKNNLYKAIKSLNSDGICVIKNYYDSETVDQMFESCNNILNGLPIDEVANNKIINNLQLENNVRIERNFGQIKIKNIQYKSDFIYNKSSKNILLWICALIYNFEFKKFLKIIFFKKITPLCIYSLIHDGSFKNKIVREGVKKNIIADIPHSDTPTARIKAFIPLKSITFENSPFVCIKKTHNDPKVIKKFVNCLYEKSYPIKNKNPYDNLELNSEMTTYFNQNYENHVSVVNKGDLVIFDSRSIHYVSNLIKGDRQILWFYY